MTTSPSSADGAIVYFGLRFGGGSAEAPSLEDGADARIFAANQAGLQHMWLAGDNAASAPVLFIGESLGQLGGDDLAEIGLTSADLERLAESVGGKLKAAGFAQPPGLFVHWRTS